MFESIDGDKQSPENKVMLLGYLIRSFRIYASKLTMPALPFLLGCMS